MSKNKEELANKQTNTKNTLGKVRIDKWLWAARFYRTRMLAKKAIESGKVHIGGESSGQGGKRVKTSREVCEGDIITIRQGSATTMGEKTVKVIALSETRGNATIAQSLYEETAESIASREFYQQQRKLANLARPDTKPNKKQRRDLQKFRSDF